MLWERKDQLVCFEQFFLYLRCLADQGMMDRDIKQLEILCQHGSEPARLRGQAVQDFLDGQRAKD
ncbi:MAG: hypothetical protein OES79_15220, partial [Planctomycetota bacterium]|nr:hypothetical protein [Planctomycetota bacterium]